MDDGGGRRENVEVPEFDGDAEAVFLRADPPEFPGAGPEYPNIAAAGNDDEGIGPGSTSARREPSAGRVDHDAGTGGPDDGRAADRSRYARRVWRIGVGARGNRTLRRDVVRGVAKH